MYAIKHKESGTFYTGDHRKLRKFGAIDYAKLYLSYQGAVEGAKSKALADHPCAVVRIKLVEVPLSHHIDSILVA